MLPSVLEEDACLQNAGPEYPARVGRSYQKPVIAYMRWAGLAFQAFCQTASPAAACQVHMMLRGGMTCLDVTEAGLLLSQRPCYC